MKSFCRKALGLVLVWSWGWFWLPVTTRADLVLYEGFDVAPGTLNGQAGATSFGFAPGSVWDSGIFGAPLVGNGSILAPATTSHFYQALPVGNRVIEDFQGTVIGREDAVSAPHLYGTVLATMNLDGTFATRSAIGFTNFSIFAANSGGGSASANWFVQTSGGTFDSGISAQGTTLISWELEFDQNNSLSPDTLRVWFNSNPMVDAPGIERTSDNLGQFDLGGINLNNNIFLGLSTAQYDEIRIGTDWSSVGISSVPEPSGLWMLAVFSVLARGRRRRIDLAK